MRRPDRTKAAFEVEPERFNGRAVLSLDGMTPAQRRRTELRDEPESADVDWGRIADAMELDADEREVFERKRLGVSIGDQMPMGKARAHNAEMRLRRKLEGTPLRDRHLEFASWSGPRIHSRNPIRKERIGPGRMVYFPETLTEENFASIMRAEVPQVIENKPSVKNLPLCRSTNMQAHSRIYEIKASQDGTFTGMLSLYNVVDLGGDMVMSGAFNQTLKDNEGRFPMLWQHNTDEPIGSLYVSDTKDGLSVVGKFALGVQRARDAYELTKEGVIKGMSIGYSAVKKKVENGVRKLEEIKLYEGSIVTFPMLPSAQIADVKAQADREWFEQSLARFKKELMEIVTR